MATKRKQQNQNGNPQVEEGARVVDQPLDQVREILFGAEVRELRGDLLELEQRFMTEMEASREETRRGFSELKKLLRIELGTVDERLGEEAQARELRSTELEQALKTARRDLEAHADRLAESMRADYARRIEALDQQANRMMKSLRNDKADRKDLAGLFQSLSERLSAEAAEPGSEVEQN